MMSERNHRTRLGLLVVTVLLVVFASAGTTQALGQASDPVEEAGCARAVDYGTAEFDDDSHLVTHPFLPLRRGTQRVFEGRSTATGETLPHRVTFTVTGLTKMIDGVRTVVVWDVDESDGQVTEAELAFFAQDTEGNVWNLGEYPEEYPDGVFGGAPNTWFAGVGEAEPGVHMLNMVDVFLPGQPEYLQGWVPEIEFLDCAKIVETGSTELVTHERSPLDPAGGVQVKHHKLLVGIDEISALDDPEGETLVLVGGLKTLTSTQLVQANVEAHKLDQRGLLCSDVYAQTVPIGGANDGDYGPYTCAAPEPPEPPPVTGGLTTAAPWSTVPAAAAVLASRPASRYRRWVDHPLFPLRKVRTMVYEGSEGGVAVRVKSRVRAKRVRIAGVLATAVDAKRRENGELVERSTDYYAQGRTGNVWHLGGRVEEIASGETRRWIAGRNGAVRGLFMPAAPQVGQSFHRTRAPGISQHRSKVLAVDAAVTTRAGRFTGCLETRDTDRRRSPLAQTRFYCPGVGLVRERSGDGILDLVRFG